MSAGPRCRGFMEAIGSANTFSTRILSGSNPLARANSFMMSSFDTFDCHPAGDLSEILCYTCSSWKLQSSTAMDRPSSSKDTFILRIAYPGREIDVAQPCS